MIKKLKRRYLITNMALLSGTLLVCLAVLFGFLYQSEINTSYSMMREMIQDTEMPEQSLIPESAEPTVFRDTASYIPLYFEGPACDSNCPETDADTETDSGEVNQFRREYREGGAFVFPSDGDNYWKGGENDGQSGTNPYWNPNAQPPWPNDTQPSWPNNTQPTWPVYPWPVYPWPVYPWPNQDWQWNPYQPPENTEQAEQEQSDGTEQTPPDTEAQIPDENADQYQEQDAEPNIVDEPEQETPLTEPREEENKPETSSETSVQKTQRTEARKTETERQKAEQHSNDTTTVPLVPAPLDTPDIQTVPPLVPVEEGQYIPDAFIAQMDSEGNIFSYSSNDVSIPDTEQFDTVHHAVNEVKRRGSNAGVIEIGDSSYRYVYEPDPTGNLRLVLLERTLEISTLNRLLFIFLLITVLGLLLVFGISLKLANWTVTPIAVAWEKQKQFVADASHELKTPLAVISANTEVILTNPQESVAGQNKWLSYIQSETMRMSKLVSNLLSVARMDNSSGKKEALRPFSLSEAVSNVCLVFEPIIYENGKTLNTVIQRNVSIITEEDNIKQLLSILLDNAVLHSLPKAQITVSLSKDVQGKIRLSVANTAKDIPPEQLAHLFDRFYRLDREGSPNGSGLGLSIARSIVRQMGGTLSVTSENQLVTFVAVFPS